jgi:hypothetical protein
MSIAAQRCLVFRECSITGLLTSVESSTGQEEVSVDIRKILEELREGRAQLQDAILRLERLAAGKGRRRGRPPKWMTPVKRPEPRFKRPGRQGGNQE